MRRRFLSVAIAASLLFSNVGINSSTLGIGAKTVYADEIVTENAEAVDVAAEEPQIPVETENNIDEVSAPTENASEEYDPQIEGGSGDEERVNVGRNVDNDTHFYYEEKEDGTHDGSDDDRFGGLVGLVDKNKNGVTIENCLFAGVVGSQAALDRGSPYEYIGGLLGRTDVKSYATEE